MQPLLEWLSQWGYLGLFLLLMFGIVGLPVPDETLLVFSGYLISQGRLALPLTLLTAFAGSACGITVSYWLGRTAGHAVLTRFGPWLHLTPQRLEQMNHWFRRFGNWLLTVGYFIPGVRHFTALVAGMSELDYPTFALFAYPGAAVWVSVFLLLGRFMGKNWQAALQLFHRYTLAVILIGALLAFVAFLIHRRLVRPRYNAK